MDTKECEEEKQKTFRPAFTLLDVDLVARICTYILKSPAAKKSFSGPDIDRMRNVRVRMWSMSETGGRHGS